MVLCARCGRGSLTTIRMRIAQREVVFQQCHECDARVWHRDGVVVSLDDVLELSREMEWISRVRGGTPDDRRRSGASSSTYRRTYPPRNAGNGVEPLVVEFSVACTPEHAFRTWTTMATTWWPPRRERNQTGWADVTALYQAQAAR